MDRASWVGIATQACVVSLSSFHSKCPSQHLYRPQLMLVWWHHHMTWALNTIRHLAFKECLNTCKVPRTGSNNYHAMQHLSSSGGCKAGSLLSVQSSAWTLSTVDQLVKNAALTCSLAQKGWHSIVIVSGKYMTKLVCMPILHDYPDPYVYIP